MKQRNYIKRFNLFLLAILLLGSLTTEVWANTPTTEQPVDGSITSRGFNNALLIDAFRLYNTSLASEPLVPGGTRLQPTFTYRLELDITEYDTLSDIASIEFRFFASGGFDLSRVDSCLDTSQTQGDAVSPHQICTWEDLDEIRNDVSAHYVLMNSLSIQVEGYSDLASATANSNQGWRPIEGFSGVFDGQGYRIDGLRINHTGDEAGLFGSTDGAEIKDLFITQAIVSASGINVGILIGSANGNTNVDNVHVQGDVFGSYLLGGLLGSLSNTNGEVTNSSADVNVSASELNPLSHQGSGGLIGFSLGTIETSYSQGNVSQAAYAGGLIGSIGGGNIKRSFSQSDVVGTSFIGGFIGGFIRSGLDDSVVENSYSLGTVTATEFSGGFVGHVSSASVTFTNNHTYTLLISTTNDLSSFGGFAGEGQSATFTSNYWNSDSSNVTDQAIGNATTAGITGLNDTEFTLQNSFVGWSIDVGLSQTWTIGVLDYPTLSWEDGLPQLPALEPLPLLTTFEDTQYTNTLGNQFVFRWERSDQNPMDHFEMVLSTGSGVALSDDSDRYFGGLTEAGISWEVINSTTPAISTTQTGMTVAVEFRISRVARLSIDELYWQFGVIIEDGLEATDETTLTTIEGLRISETNPLSGDPTLYGMEWYGQVNIDEGALVQWQNLRAGSNFDESNNESQLNKDVTFFSNGAYQRDIVSDAQWTMNPNDSLPDGSTPAAILNQLHDIADSVLPQHFGLRVSEGVAEHDINAGAVVLDSVNVMIDYSVTQTDEAGFTSSYYFFIALSSNFQNAGYSGKLNFIVLNYLPGN